MSRKQKIYRDILRDSLSLCRNIQSASIWQKATNKTCLYELELVHNIPISILDEKLLEHDIWFINNQMVEYLKRCNQEISPNYENYKHYFRELIHLLPENMKSRLDVDIEKLLEE